MGQTYSTLSPVHCSVSMRDKTGMAAASVLPPAVGASSRQCLWPWMGAIAANCVGRSPGQPSVLTTWYWTAGCSCSKALTTRCHSPTLRPRPRVRLPSFLTRPMSACSAGEDRNRDAGPHGQARHPPASSGTAWVPRPRARPGCPPRRAPASAHKHRPPPAAGAARWTGPRRTGRA